MFFDKPDIRYVDMCIYIDDNIYTDKCDNALVYEYLYHIINMLATRRNYFTSVKITEDFSLYASSIYYMRLIDERQFDDSFSIEPIRSILNYIKKTLYSIRGEYAKKFLKDKEVFSDVDVISLDLDSFRSYTSNTTSPLDRCEFNFCLSDIKESIKEELKRIPYRYGSSEWNNIYISCLLSFLNSVTLKNRDIKRLKNFKRPTSLTDKLLDDLYMKERYNSTILYHLDDSMYSYITVLTNRIRNSIAKELSQTLHKSMPSCINMKNLLMANTMEQEYLQ